MSEKSKIRILMPREHGAWAILLLSFFLGLGMAGEVDKKALILLGSILAIHISRAPLLFWAKSPTFTLPQGTKLSFFLLASLGLGLALWLVLGYGLWHLLPLGVLGFLLFLLHLYLARQRQERSLIGELAGMWALALTAPAAFYTVGGEGWQSSFLAWLLSILFFGSGIFYVRMKVGTYFNKTQSTEQKRRLATSFALVVVLLLSYLRWVPSLSLLAFAPITLQAVWGILKTDNELSFRKLGFTQVGHTVIFALLLMLLLRLYGV